ncbi:hypothetical protein [Desulfosporosinus sp. FKB]|uniref:hypothetical protein n=1 Tax=Desulfosporosinus sp. FKB TaxID=1969835 RepID=UPI000B4A145F|nr:hypothetical protein [Desulfosporosinus sp. FKB]
MESLELVDSSLNLTHKGAKLAKAFVDNGIYDRLVLKAISEQKVVEREGRASLKSLGYHTSLDSFSYNNFHPDERALLREYILDNSKNNVAVRYIFQCYDFENDNVLETIKNIVSSPASTEPEQMVIEGYKTILAFENLAIVFNRLWCAFIKAADETFGVLPVSRCVAACKEHLNSIFETNIIKELVTRNNYSEIIESYHGSDFQNLLWNTLNLQSGDYGEFIIHLVKYHNNVMQRRGGGSWIYIDGTNLIVTTGYDYPKKTEDLLYLHSYKVPNIMTLIEDTGWQI